MLLKKGAILSLVKWKSDGQREKTSTRFFEKDLCVRKSVRPKVTGGAGPVKRMTAAVLSLAILFGSGVATHPASAKFMPEAANIARQSAVEGIVMLKNEDNVLPIKAGAPISVFGRCQVDTFTCGYGSGSAPKAPYTRVSILDGIEKNPTIQYNKELAAIYEKWCEENPASGGSWGNWPYYHPEMPVTDALIAQAREKSATAVVVIGRAAGEDRECKLEAGSYYLTQAEKDLLAKVNAKFEDVVILLNVGNIMDMAWLDDYTNIKSVMYVWQGGLDTGNAVADVLSGDISPSGKLSSTIAKTYNDYPSSKNFGGRAFNNYVEDVYVGYRYFESFAKDRVAYPFGFGLSYTDFQIEPSVTYDSKDITVTAKVTNTGSTYSGKEVVQVYYAAPQGVLGKPARALAGYAKTNEIAPGESQTVTVSFPIDNMASYDDSGKSGHKSAWVLEAGDYGIYVGNSVRAAEKAGDYTLPELKVVEQLEEASAAEQSFQRMVNDGSGTPKYEDVPLAENNLAERVLADLPEAVALTGDQGIKLIDVYNGTKTMDEFIAQLTPVELEAILRGDYNKGSQLAIRKTAASVFGGTIQSLRDKGIPPISTHDGPSGPHYEHSATNLPIGTMLACTWNDPLVEKLYHLVGLEMADSEADALLAPGMNIHRDPLCGRNFEYFSEDPLLTGQMGADATIGLQNAGVSSTPKHFALNNQEVNRRSNDSRCSERAQREIYLRSFEICVKSSKPYNLMASYNLINGEWSHYNYDMATTILRKDWGFEGVLMTDWWLQRGKSDLLGGVEDNAYRIRAQVDVNMPGEGPNGSGANDQSLLTSYNKWVEAGSPAGTLNAGITLGEMQRSARNVLNYVMESRVFRAMHDLPNTYQPGEPWFTVNGVREEVKPTLETIKVEGMDFLFNPATTLYEVFWRDMSKPFPKVSATADGGTVTVIQATADVPAATITVNKDGGKNTYRLIFTDKAGLNPVTANPAYATVTGIQVDGKYLAEFYPTVYTYQVRGTFETAEVHVDVAEGVDCELLRKEEDNQIIVRAETDDQAREYILQFAATGLNAPQADSFDVDGLNRDIWQVIGETDQMSVQDGVLFIRTEGGEWYGTGTGKNNMKNVLYQTVGQDWTATVKLAIPAPANLKGKDTNQFGIAVFENPDNYADMNYCTASWAGSGHFLQVRQETNGVCNDKVSTQQEDWKASKELPTTEKWAGKDVVNVWMRVRKEGTQYTFSIQTEDMKAQDADAFATLGIVNANYAEPKIGLYASRGNGNATTSTVVFDDFTVDVQKGPQSDHFDDGQVAAYWSFLNRNDSTLSEAEGALSIQTEGGEWYGTGSNKNNMKNVLYQNAKGNWTATVEMVIPKPAELKGKDTNQFGVVAFSDPDNYVDMNYCTASWASDGQLLQVRQEIKGVCNDKISGQQADWNAAKGLPTKEKWAEKDAVTVWMRVQKEVDQYTFSIQTEAMKAQDADAFTTLGVVTANYAEPKFGIYASKGNGNTTTSTVKINDVTFTDYEDVPEPEPETPDPVAISSDKMSRVMAVDDALFLTSKLKPEATQDPTTPKGYHLAYGTDTSDYAIYAIQVEKAGYYDMSTRVSSGISNELAQLNHTVEMDGQAIAEFSHRTTGGWQKFIDTQAQRVYLPAGRHTLRFCYEAQINFNYITFAPVSGYHVTVDGDMQHGMITANPSDAPEGTKISLTVVPEKGYRLAEGSLKAYKTGDAGTTVAIADNAFQMPSYDVTVTAVFVKIESEPQTLSVTYNGKDVALLVDGEPQKLADLIGKYVVKDVEPGTKTELTFVPRAQGRQFRSVIIGTAQPELIEGDAYTYTVTMGDQEIDLNFVFEVTDKAILEQTYAYAAGYVEDGTVDKLVSSVKKAFMKAFEEAETVLDDAAATQEQIDEAWSNLMDVLHYLDFQPGDKTALENLYDLLKNLSEDDFTSTSWALFEEMSSAAEAVLMDKEALEGDITNAYNNLLDACDKLVRVADRSELDAVIARAELVAADIAEGKYMEDGQAAFQTALDEAKAIDQDASQKDVNAAADKLLQAMADLRKLPSRNELKAYIEKIEQLDLSGYTDRSVANLNAALSVAKAVAADENADSSTLAKAFNTLKDAENGLEAVEKPAPTPKPDTNTNKGSKKSSSSISKGNLYGASGIVAANPLVDAAQNISSRKVFVVSDTTVGFTLKRGQAYCFKMTVVNGDVMPDFTAGNSNVLKTQFVEKVGNDYYYRVYAVGAPGQSAGVYTTLPGQSAQRHCVVTVQ